MYNIRPTTKFQKDLKRVKKRGFDIPLLTDIIKKLAAGEPLPEKNRDHQLSLMSICRKWQKLQLIEQRAK